MLGAACEAMSCIDGFGRSALVRWTVTFPGTYLFAAPNPRPVVSVTLVQFWAGLALGLTTYDPALSHLWVKAKGSIGTRYKSLWLANA